MAESIDSDQENSESDESFSDDGEVDTDDADQSVARNSKTPPEKKAKISKKELYRPPTNEELNQLKETENLFHSSLFRLQVCNTEIVEMCCLKVNQHYVLHVLSSLC